MFRGCFHVGEVYPGGFADDEPESLNRESARTVH